MFRRPDSHKGENGKVAVIGGSPGMHGAPLLSALAAEASGADLVYVSLPRCHGDAAKLMSLNFQVHPFAGDDIDDEDVQPILELLATADSAVIGPGLSRTNDAQRVMRQIIEGSACPLVLDASALQPWTLEACNGKTIVCTPHRGELERMHFSPEEIDAVALRYHVTIHGKGRTDHIAAADGSLHTVAGGNAGLTVGGTGDALAGLIAGLMAQGLEPKDACAMASRTLKRAGTLLYETYGYAYTAKQVIGCMAGLLREMQI